MISLCRYVIMFRLCKLNTSVNTLRHNTIKNQSERLKNVEPSLPRSSTIFKMAAAGRVECVDEHMDPDIKELRMLSEAVRRYPILYDKTLKEFKGAVSRQSSSFCLILQVTRPQSLWNLKAHVHPNGFARLCFCFETILLSNAVF